jgi:hypothetical protein
MVSTLYSIAFIDVKTGCPDPADFALNRLLIEIYPLAYRAVTAAICRWLHMHIAQPLRKLPTLATCFL